MMFQGEATSESGEPILILGLSARNIELLREGKSIYAHFTNVKIGQPTVVQIHFRETLDELHKLWNEMPDLPNCVHEVATLVHPGGSEERY